MGDQGTLTVTMRGVHNERLPRALEEDGCLISSSPVAKEPSTTWYKVLLRRMGVKCGSKSTQRTAKFNVQGGGEGEKRKDNFNLREHVELDIHQSKQAEEVHGRAACSKFCPSCGRECYGDMGLRIHIQSRSCHPQRGVKTGSQESRSNTRKKTEGGTLVETVTGMRAGWKIRLSATHRPKMEAEIGGSTNKSEAGVIPWQWLTSTRILGYNLGTDDARDYDEL